MAVVSPRGAAHVRLPAIAQPNGVSQPAPQRSAPPDRLTVDRDERALKAILFISPQENTKNSKITQRIRVIRTGLSIVVISVISVVK